MSKKIVKIDAKNLLKLNPELAAELEKLLIKILHVTDEEGKYVRGLFAIDFGFEEKKQ